MSGGSIVGAILLSVTFIWLLVILFLRWLGGSGPLMLFSPDPQKAFGEDQNWERWRQKRQAVIATRSLPAAVVCLIVAVILLMVN